MTDTTIIIEEIRAALEGASGGEWGFDGPTENVIIWNGPDTRICFMTSDGPAKANASYIVAVQPDRIRSLLEDYDQLRTGIKRLSDEEELCAETTGDDPFSMVYLAAKMDAREKELAEMVRSADESRVAQIRRAEAAESRVRELEGALEPFAARAGVLDGIWRDHETHWSPAYGSTEVTVGDLRTARAVLKGETA